MNLFDTIIARITPDGESAVAVVRISGGNSLAYLSKITEKNTFKPRKAVLVKIVLSGGVKDFALAVYYPKPGSYTGEDVCEISVHGNQYLVRKLIETCVDMGARIADRGEFTYRAYMNGKMDLSQVEGVLSMINSSNESSLRRAGASLEGNLGRKVKKSLENLDLCRAELEICALEEDTYPKLSKDFYGRLKKAFNDVDEIASWSSAAAKDFEKPQVFIIGPPNAGKSTLFNRFYGSHRVVVSDAPGTTRDMIREEVDFPGGMIRLVDGAGLRDEHFDSVEKLGKEILLDKLRGADAVIVLLDAVAEWKSDLKKFSALTEGKKRVLALNKSDLAIEVGRLPEEILPVSAVTGENLDSLKREISTKLWGESAENKTSDGDPFVSERASLLASEALSSIKRAEKNIEKDVWDIAAYELEKVSENLGSIIGVHVKPGEIVALFDKFCVGK
ncbi:tRNA uridine-5-carboxymethylaminomethyl(34) synthesis GTPase MnmE [candidate division WOR-3 bacterium]|nr:tRNA uridine-5-carboxymethylaminomethyl(34) synthesis GTPase MnmE [candidate division WOR-3 bacterium]